MADILLVAISNIFSWMSVVAIQLQFYWHLFLGISFRINMIGSGYGLAHVWHQAISWISDDLP